MLIITGLLAFYLAWNLGANDVANSMGTSVGSKAVTLRQAIILAGIFEFVGAVLFGHRVSATLTTKIADLTYFAQTPETLIIGMLSVLIAAGLWLNLATILGLPVSSSHAVVGAIAGFAWIASSPQSIDWASIRVISLTWVITPVVSAVIAAACYSLVKHWILEQSQPLDQLQEWIPWLSTALLSTFGIIVLPTVGQPLQAFLANQWGLVIPFHTISIAVGAIALTVLNLTSWRSLAQVRSNWDATVTQGTPVVEQLIGRFQLLSACFVAFAHGSNDVGNAIAPLAAIVQIHQTGAVPLENFQVPLWILMVGGLGIVSGLVVLGKHVITTIGEKIIPLRPSSGLCAEFATATTVLLASHLGLPVSTSHALVGAVIGIGMIQSLRSVQWKTLESIGLAWVLTVPVAAFLGGSIFSILRLFTLGMLLR